jgi:hypothetical protein
VGQATIIVTFIVASIKLSGKVGMYFGATDQKLSNLSDEFSGLKRVIEKHIDADDSRFEALPQKVQLSLSNSIASVAANMRDEVERLDKRIDRVEDRKVGNG